MRRKLGRGVEEVFLAMIGSFAVSCSGADQLSPPEHGGTGGAAGAAGGGAPSSSGGSQAASGGAPGGTGNAAAAGGSTGTPPATLACGSDSCTGVPVPAPFSVSVDPCCSAQTKCGLDMTILKAYQINFETVCQELHQPGAISASCPPSTPVKSPVPGFKDVQSQGCCRAATSTCGYLLDHLSLKADGTVQGFDDIELELSLGCMDAAPFDKAAGKTGAAPSCTP